MAKLGYNIKFPIYNSDGTKFHNLVLRKAVYDSVVMSLGDKITGDVYYKDNTLSCTMQEYVEYGGVKFMLANPPTIVREGMASDNGDMHGMTKYSFEFYHPMFMLLNLPFTDIAVSNDELQYKSQDKTFSWIGYLDDFVAKLNKNLQNTQWVCDISDAVPSDKLDKLSEVLSFDKTTIGDALKTAYETWKVPFVIDVLADSDSRRESGKEFVILFGLPSNEIYASVSDKQQDNPFIFNFGKGVGLKNDSRTPKNNKIITRIAGYGAERNVPFGYPQIIWRGNPSFKYTILDDPTNPHSYPIYKGIVNGQWVNLIKHPFTRNHLMPTVYAETVAKKVDPFNPNYDPNTTIIDYHDATNPNIYPNVINSLAPSYESHEFEDIYPRLGTEEIVDAYPINNNRERQEEWDDTMNDDGEYVQSYFMVTLPQLDFDLYACAAITEEMQINMRGGACIGCTFDVMVDWEDYKKNFYDAAGNFVPDGSQRDLTKYPKSNEGEIDVVCQKDNETFGILMPNVYQQPKSGDEFTILGISLPQSYITNGQIELDDAMDEYMLENNVYYFEYPLKFDEHFLVTHQYILSQIRNNTIVRFEYNGNIIPLYVKQITITYGENPLPQYNITLTDDVEIVLNQIGQVTDDVSRMRVQVSALQRYFDKGIGVDLQNKLSRVSDDTANGLITFKRGWLTQDNVASNEFLSGWTGNGWRVSKSGDAEFDNLTIRRSMKVFELLIQQVRSTGGEIVVSAANGRVSDVVSTTPIVLNIENASDNGDSFDNMFVVGDIVRCQRWDAQHNSTHYWTATVIQSTNHSIQLGDFTGDLPMVGDEVVQMGNTTNTDRQGVITISASEGGEPKVTILDGVNSTNLAGKTRVVLGGLSGVVDGLFGQLNGYGLYSDNAYLRGEFRLANGDDIGARLTATAEMIQSVVRGSSKDGNLVVNGFMDWFDGWFWQEQRTNPDVVRNENDPFVSGEKILVEPQSNTNYPETHYEYIDNRYSIHTYPDTEVYGTLTPPTTEGALSNIKLSLWLKATDDVHVEIGNFLNEDLVVNGGTVVEKDGAWEKHELTFDIEWSNNVLPTIDFDIVVETWIADVRVFQPVESRIEQTADRIELSVGNELALTGISITQHRITLKGNTYVQTGHYSGSLFTSKIIDGVEKSVFSSDLIITEQVIATWPTGEKRITINYGGNGTLQYWYPLAQGETTQALMRSEEISYDANGNINGFSTLFYDRDGTVRWKQSATGNYSGSAQPTNPLNWTDFHYTECGLVSHDEPDSSVWDVVSTLQPDVTLWKRNGSSSGLYFEDATLDETSTKTEQDEEGNEYNGWVCDPQMEWVSTPETEEGTGYYRRWVGKIEDGLLVEEDYKLVEEDYKTITNENE